MDVSLATILNDTLPTGLRQAKPAPAKPQAAATSPLVPTKSANATGTNLVDESQEDTTGGYRKTSTFEQADGRRFTRIEDFAFTDQGAKRTIVQQNPSGSITRYEEVLDRETGGNFRRTQRFQDGTGEISTQITADYQVTDPFILTNGGTSGTYGSFSSFASIRGTQLDLVA